SSAVRSGTARTTTCCRADVRRQIAHHVGKLGALGFEVTLCRTPNPDQTEQATAKPPDRYSPPDAGSARNRRGPLPPRRGHVFGSVATAPRAHCLGALLPYPADESVWKRRRESLANARRATGSRRPPWPG